MTNQEVALAFHGPTDDRVAVRERLESYADALFRRDEDAWAACWAPDAVWHFVGEEVHGLPAILTTWRDAMAPFSLTLFQVQPGEIIVTGETARARSYTSETLFLVAGGARRITGRYDDDLVRTSGVWRFAVRRYTLLHEVT